MYDGQTVSGRWAISVKSYRQEFTLQLFIMLIIKKVSLRVLVIRVASAHVNETVYQTHPRCVYGTRRGLIQPKFNGELNGTSGAHGGRVEEMARELSAAMVGSD